MRRRFWICLGVLSLPLLLGFSGGRFVFLVPPVVATPDPRIEAAIILTGSHDRLQAGLELFKHKHVKYLFISGVYPGLKLPELLRAMQELPQAWQEGIVCDRTQCIELGDQARNTRGNAEESLAWAKQRQVQKAYLVTSDYHCPRSILEFQAAFAKAQISIELVGYPVIRNDSGVSNVANFKIWSKTWGQEYIKWLVANLRIFLENFFAI